VFADHPLDESTVLDYFTHSRFYDRSCNNERARGAVDPAARLREMRGVEYAVVRTAHRGPAADLLTIERRYRHSETHVDVQAVYYVLQGVVYQAPHLHTVLSSRLVRDPRTPSSPVQCCSTLPAFPVCAALYPRPPSPLHAAAHPGPCSCFVCLLRACLLRARTGA
jgi:hypothetical protein